MADIISIEGKLQLTKDKQADIIRKKKNFSRSESVPVHPLRI